ncbi:MAG: phytanoyl-CoA dioxygenase family protein [Candidatus Handelsmanbacteria bacterium]|nr:phytanoyl-CoA dioxygenase family protein [Candidatus Handelsmanbacteria bacterium]
MSTSQEIMQAARTQFQRDGYCVAPPLIEPELLARVIPRMDAVMQGEYETGATPLAHWKPGDSPTKIRKIDQPHLSDRTIRQLVTHPEVGRWAAMITAARRIQVWAVQMLYKPPGGDEAGNIGWHQDRQYWSYWQEGSEVFTAWVAVSEVGADSGPMCFVPGSHHWGFLGRGDFFGTDHDAQRSGIPVPAGQTWREVPALMAPGAVSCHHALTYHGSGPNGSAQPRRSFALHMRTENARPVPGATDYYVSHLNDLNMCPVIYE